MFWRLLLLEKDKLAGRFLLWIELGILALFIVGGDMLDYILINLPLPGQKQLLLERIIWPQGLVNTVEVGFFGSTILIITIAVVTAQEYSWRTFHLWLSRGVSRTALMVAKCIMMISLAVLIMLTSLIIGAIVTGILTLALKGTLPFAQINIQMLFLNFLITGLGLLPYAAFTFMLTILFRNVVVSMAIGLLITLVVENVLYITLSGINQVTQTIANYLPVGLHGSLSNAVLGVPPDSVNTPTPLLACIGILVYTGVFAGIGIWSFRHQDFTD